MKDNLEIIIKDEPVFGSPEAPDCPASDRFSWSRVLMVARYWWPRLRMQFWICLAVSLLAGVGGGFFDFVFDSTKGANIMSVASYIAFIAPAIFALKKGRELDVTLPARNSEKTTFFLLYSLIVIPGIMYMMSVSYWLINGSHFKTMMAAEFGDMLKDILDSSYYDYVWIVNILYTLSLAMVCLYGAIFYKRNAVVKSILTTLATLWCPSLIVGFIAGITAFELGLRTAVNGMPPNPEEVISGIMPSLFWIMVILAIASTILFIVLLWLFIRKYPKRQV